MYRSWEKAKTKCSLEGAKLFYAEDENEVDMVLADLNNTHPIIGWVYVGISSHLAKGVFKTVDGEHYSKFSIQFKKTVKESSFLAVRTAKSFT